MSKLINNKERGMRKKDIVISSDHAGFELKKYLKKKLEEEGFLVNDTGPSTNDRIDYPDTISKGAKAICKDENKSGVFICGSGLGASMVANKYKGIRAALVYDKKTAVLSREHNNANVIVFGERLISPAKAWKLFKIWWNTEFSDKERHIHRVEKLNKLGD